MPKNLIVTCALPYANGHIHLGHMVEHIQADIWVRFNKLRGQKCYFICADDTHGTPIMLKAKDQGLTPEQLIALFYTAHTMDLGAFGISYDHYYTTNSGENKHCAYAIYNELKARDKIARKTIRQLFDDQEQMFLPDRYVKGTCPKCNAHEQYGDSCENCGATYAPTDLINPYSVISGAKPVVRESEHYFFKLSACGEFLQQYLDAPQRVQPEVRNKLQEWLSSGLQDWDISRDKPYFGFEIPDAPGKYFYVWLDAPVGYLSSFMHYCTLHKLDFHKIWNAADTQICHFIGKDILYFHVLFWPAVLDTAGYRTPDNIYAHGFLTIDGAKMSKSRGTFITARSFIAAGLNPEFFRYYIAGKLTASIEDIDFSAADFSAKINAELVGKFINIASRVAGFIERKFANQLAGELKDTGLLVNLLTRSEEIASLYSKREYAKVLRIIMQLTDEVNHYVDNAKPWLLAKDSAHAGELHQVCSILLNAFRILALYLKPIVPGLVTKIEQFLNIPPLMWSDADKFLLRHTINNYQHLLSRIEPSMLDKMLEINRGEVSPMMK